MLFQSKLFNTDRPFHLMIPLLNFQYLQCQCQTLVCLLGFRKIEFSDFGDKELFHPLSFALFPSNFFDTEWLK